MSTARPLSGASHAETTPQSVARFAAEPTASGLQALVPGVAPITPRDRLLARASAPLAPKKPQRPCDLGLFDMNARNQLCLFDRLAPAVSGAGPVES